jgi:hypothetical protein
LSNKPDPKSWWIPPSVILGIAFWAFLLFALTACGPHVDQPLPMRSDSAQTAASTTAKPARPIGMPETFKPGLNHWDNGDGTAGAVFVRVGAEP